MTYADAVMAVWVVALLVTFVALLWAGRAVSRAESSRLAVVEATDAAAAVAAAVGPLDRATQAARHDRTDLLDR